MNKAQKCSILGPQNLGSRGLRHPGPHGSAPVGAGAEGPMSDVGGRRAGAGGRAGVPFLMSSSEVQHIMDNGHTWTPPPREQTDTSENITFLQHRWQAVKTIIHTCI